MRIDTWHRARVSNDPEYARAIDLLEFAQNVADAVVGLRVRLQLTQAQVAELSGTTQSVISRLETGGSNPTVETVSKVLASLLDASVACLTPAVDKSLARDTEAVARGEIAASSTRPLAVSSSGDWHPAEAMHRVAPEPLAAAA